MSDTDEDYGEYVYFCVTQNVQPVSINDPHIDWRDHWEALDEEKERYEEDNFFEPEEYDDLPDDWDMGWGRYDDGDWEPDYGM